MLYKQKKYPGSMLYERMSNGVCNVEIYKAVMFELIKCLEKRGVTKDQLCRWDGESPMPILNSQELSKIKVVAENELGKQLYLLEESLNDIGTISVLAPSLGLFGTVWGVLLSFMSMADGSGAAIITNVAPGIGGALLTTVVGLIVSIPMTYGYNKLCSRMRQYTTQAENFVDKLVADIYLYYSPNENAVQNIQLAVVQQQPQYTSQENYEVGGKYNA
jgi:biopolymer transport protein TolQ